MPRRKKHHPCLPQKRCVQHALIATGLLIVASTFIKTGSWVSLERVTQPSPTLGAEMEEPSPPHDVAVKSERKLGFLASVKPIAQSAPGIGCVSVSITSMTATTSLDVSTLACGGNRCPPCFAIDASSTLAAVDYVLGSDGAHECHTPSGLFQIPDAQSCYKLYDKYKTQYTQQGFEEVWKADYPAGCYHLRGGQKVEFNKFRPGSWDGYDAGPLVVPGCIKAAKLEIKGCSSMKIGNTQDITSLGTSAVVGIMFMNIGTAEVLIKDESGNKFMLYPKMAKQALCSAGGSNALMFDAGDRQGALA